MLRLIVKETKFSPVADTQLEGIEYKTFDLEAPEVVAFLTAHRYGCATVIGAEIIKVRPAE